jgi:hypothetical protein
VWGKPKDGTKFHIPGTVIAVNESGNTHFIEVLNPISPKFAGFHAVTTSSMKKYSVEVDREKEKTYYAAGKEWLTLNDAQVKESAEISRALMMFSEQT